MDLNEAIDAFNATEANLGKLERLWPEMADMLPSVTGGMVIESVSDEAAFKRKARQFRLILEAIPKIDGVAIPDCLPDPDSLQNQILDFRELDDPSAYLTFERHLHSQGDALAEFRFRLDTKRRDLIRRAVLAHIDEVDKQLSGLGALVVEGEPNSPIPDEPLAAMRKAVKSIDSLMGSSVSRPKRWSDLSRHLHFGALQDLRDIVHLDWPNVRKGLERSVRGEEDPVPVSIADLGEITGEEATGQVITELNWRVLDAGGFERLLFNLLDNLRGYENPQWLTHTNAPDRGRDLSVYRVQSDELAGVERKRAIVACKHYLSKSISVAEVTELRSQMALWSPPRVDVLIIATSGRFTTDAVDLIERHNLGDTALQIDMLSGTDLERLLAARPALVAEFGLR